MPRKTIACPLCRKTGPNVRTGVDYDAIQRSFNDGQMVGINMLILSEAHLREAKVLSPNRTGRMRAQHYKRPQPATPGPRRAWYVGTTARYAKFVIEGTKNDGAGLIFPTRGEELELRPIPYSWFRPGSEGRFRESVHGQRSQTNWLKTSLIWAMHSVGMIPTAVAFAQASKHDK